MKLRDRWLVRQFDMTERRGDPTQDKREKNRCSGKALGKFQVRSKEVCSGSDELRKLSLAIDF